MKCPRCNGTETKVVDSREVRDGVRRRRQCGGCGFRFTTRERFDFAPISVQKRTGRTESFDRGKIVAAVKLVVGKRPVSLAAIEALSFGVERKFMRVPGDAKVQTADIARAVAEELRRLDPIAARRFTASYVETEGGVFTKLESLEADDAAPHQLNMFSPPTSRKN